MTSGPASTRFRKGQSGNPKGRPRKEKAQTSAFDIIIDRTLTITQNGRAREVSVDEALQHKTYLDALAGNRAARRQVLRMIAKREKAITAKMQRPPRGRGLFGKCMIRETQTRPSRSWESPIGAMAGEAHGTTDVSSCYSNHGRSRQRLPGERRVISRCRTSSRREVPRVMRTAWNGPHRTMNDRRTEIPFQVGTPKSDAIGYRRPPVSTRFQKGRSGNPKGRPRGQRERTPVRRRTRPDGDDPGGRGRASVQCHRSLPAPDHETRS